MENFTKGDFEEIDVIRLIRLVYYRHGNEFGLGEAPCTYQIMSDQEFLDRHGKRPLQKSDYFIWREIPQLTRKT